LKRCRRAIDAGRRWIRRGARAVFGDANAQAYSDRHRDRKLRWKTKVDTHADAIVTGAFAFQ